MKSKRTIRRLLLGLGLIAILALFSMNIYSLLQVRETMLTTEIGRKKAQLEEVTDLVRMKLYEPFWGFTRIELEKVEKEFITTGAFPEKFKDVLKKASESAYFSDIYYTPFDVEPCGDTPISRYDPDASLFGYTTEYEDLICDGVGLVRSRAKILVDDYEYRWNNIVEFDTHRSMNIALINLNDRTVFGYLTFVINKESIISGLIQPTLAETFGNSSESGIVVWLHDWVKGEVLAQSDESIPFDYDLVDFRQRFPNFFSNWNLKVHFSDGNAAVAYNSTLLKNLGVLSAAVIILFGALIFMYITAQRERQLSLRQAGFLANVTHELKTPLAVMQAAGENISDGRVDEPIRLKRYGEHIYNEAIRLKKMIDKLLDVAKVDAGQAVLKAKPQLPDALLNDFEKEHNNYLKARGFELSLQVEANLPMIMIDSESFETIMSNLLENAIKYSGGSNKIIIGAKRDKKNISISVKDFGIGISKTSQKYIFDKFYRVEDSLTATTKGHGLGLSIVKNHVDLNGGKIQVESEIGEGTTFTISFPIFIENDTFSNTRNGYKEYINKKEEYVS